MKELEAMNAERYIIDSPLRNSVLSGVSGFIFYYFFGGEGLSHSLLISAFAFLLSIILISLIKHWPVVRKSHPLLNEEGSQKEPRITFKLLKKIIPTDEQEHITGDLLEEFNEKPPGLGAYLWLYRQVLKSAPPLIYMTVKNRLASYFGKRIR